MRTSGEFNLNMESVAGDEAAIDPVKTARAVVGSRIEEPAAAPTGSAADGMIRRNIDTSMGYCSSRVTRPDTSVAKARVPAALAVPIRYGMTIVSTSKDGRRMGAAKRLASYLRGAEAQALLASFGFNRVQWDDRVSTGRRADGGANGSPPLEADDQKRPFKGSHPPPMSGRSFTPVPGLRGVLQNGRLAGFDRQAERRIRGAQMT